MLSKYVKGAEGAGIDRTGGGVSKPLAGPTYRRRQNYVILFYFIQIYSDFIPSYDGTPPFVNGGKDTLSEYVGDAEGSQIGRTGGGGCPNRSLDRRTVVDRIYFLFSF